MSDAKKMLNEKWRFYRHVNDEGAAYTEETYTDMMAAMKDVETYLKEEDFCPKKAEELAKALDDRFEELEMVHEPESTKVPLWNEGNVPDMTDGSWKAESPDPETFYPHIVPFLHNDGQNHPALIVVGGGIRANMKEGFPYCRYFFEKGYNTFLLNHRVGGDQINYGLDIQRAIRHIRYNAKMYGVDEKRIAAVGSSMGGVVIITFIELIKPGTIPSDYAPDYVPDEIDKMSDELQAVMGIYTSSAPNKPRPENVDYTAYPPMFIVLGNKDGGLKFQVRYMNDLVANGVRVEARIFDGGVHGFGLADGKITPNGDGEQIDEIATWPRSAESWLKRVLYENIGLTVAYEKKY